MTFPRPVSPAAGDMRLEWKSAAGTRTRPRVTLASIRSTRRVITAPLATLDVRSGGSARAPQLELTSRSCGLSRRCRTSTTSSFGEPRRAARPR